MTSKATELNWNPWIKTIEGFVGSPTASEYMRVPSSEVTYSQVGVYGVDIRLNEWLG